LGDGFNLIGFNTPICSSRDGDERSNACAVCEQVYSSFDLRRRDVVGDLVVEL
jgi:hypothetical protein